MMVIYVDQAIHTGKRTECSLHNKEATGDPTYSTRYSPLPTPEARHLASAYRRSSSTAQWEMHNDDLDMHNALV